ncbi:ALK and LTK ligand 2-like [Boleophthalmus pectinirostris]|uniref:ALK and LTK ligand 2-like n=1 Tax=Boleophthalmus pectinirostris TaxID=150288 RepID=UPI00242FA802|nr:ALK and LTK ligand 2-like [Boleophthalmus pectinirostris]
MGAMRGPRTHFAMGLVLLVCALTGRSVSAPSGASPAGRAQQEEKEREDYRRLVEAVRHVDESRGRASTRRETAFSSRSRVSVLETRDLRSSRTGRGEQVAVSLRNPKQKGKFLQHIAGPLYFSQKCRKHAYRLYHQTRDCTIPAYFKRCARLLTRLAGSPQCMEG